MLNKRTAFMAIVSLILLNSLFVLTVGAIVPEVQNVVFSSMDDDTIMDVTIYHAPVTSFHYVNLVEVDIEGVITSYSVTQTDSTFTASINLGEITGTPTARVRAFCTIDGWSSWTSQQTIPEFPSWIILPLFLIVTLSVVAIRKKLDS